MRSDIGARRDPFLPAAILLGLGLGGFFDGIVLHQILQWHHMVSTPTPPDTLADLELNTVADGLFHAATWIVTLAGVVLLLIAGGDRAVERIERLTDELLAKDEFLMQDGSSAAPHGKPGSE